IRRINLVAGALLNWRGLVDLQTAVERAQKRRGHLRIRILHFATILGPGSHLGVVLLADLGLAGKEHSEVSAILAGDPGAFVADDLAVLVLVDFLAEVIEIAGFLVDGEAIA